MRGNSRNRRKFGRTGELLLSKPIKQEKKNPKFNSVDRGMSSNKSNGFSNKPFQLRSNSNSKPFNIKTKPKARTDYDGYSIGYQEE